MNWTCNEEVERLINEIMGNLYFIRNNNINIDKYGHDSGILEDLQDVADKIETIRSESEDFAVKVYKAYNAKNGAGR